MSLLPETKILGLMLDIPCRWNPLESIICFTYWTKASGIASLRFSPCSFLLINSNLPHPKLTEFSDVISSLFSKNVICWQDWFPIRHNLCITSFCCFVHCLSNFLNSQHIIWILRLDVLRELSLMSWKCFDLCSIYAVFYYYWYSDMLTFYTRLTSERIFVD